MKILITGANGQLGRCLQDAIERCNQGTAVSNVIEYRALTRQQLDIGDHASVLKAVKEYLPTILINAAAYTAVDKAEQESTEAYRINAEGPRNLAQACAEFDIPLIHVSTDYVFDGESEQPYTEADTTEPLGVYGESKLAGETNVMTHCDKHLIVRTAWVFSEYGNNFLKTMLKLAGERDELGIVADQRGAPTYAGDLASALISMAVQVDKKPSWGLYHYSGGNVVSWYDFAMSIFAKAKEQGALVSLPRVSAITSDQFPTPLKRPAYSGLSAQKFANDFDIDAGDWEQGIDHVLARFADR